MNVLVAVAHPDDDVLGCGATIALHAEAGDVVNVLIIGDGVTARYSEKEIESEKIQKEVDNIKNNASKAVSILGVKYIDIKGINCCRFDKISLLDITKIIEEAIRRYEPDVIYTHSPTDANNDHTLVFKATQIATRPMQGSTIKEVLLMEVLSSTEWGFYECFKPNVYVDVGQTINKKILAMKMFETEIKNFPHPRSLEAINVLAKKRGMEVGLFAAEAFQLLRSIR